MSRRVRMAVVVADPVAAAHVSEGQPAVDNQDLAGHVAGRAAGEEHRRSDELVGVRQPPEEGHLGHPFLGVRRVVAHHVGVGAARGEGVDPDAIAGQLGRHDPGELQKARLGRV